MAESGATTDRRIDRLQTDETGDESKQTTPSTAVLPRLHAQRNLTVTTTATGRQFVARMIHLRTDRLPVVSAIQRCWLPQSRRRSWPALPYVQRRFQSATMAPVPVATALSPALRPVTQRQIAPAAGPSRAAPLPVVQAKMQRVQEPASARQTHSRRGTPAAGDGPAHTQTPAQPEAQLAARHARTVADAAGVSVLQRQAQRASRTFGNQPGPLATRVTVPYPNLATRLQAHRAAAVLQRSFSGQPHESFRGYAVVPLPSALQRRFERHRGPLTARPIRQPIGWGQSPPGSSASGRSLLLARGVQNVVEAETNPSVAQRAVAPPSAGHRSPVVRVQPVPALQRMLGGPAVSAVDSDWTATTHSGSPAQPLVQRTMTSAVTRSNAWGSSSIPAVRAVQPTATPGRAAPSLPGPSRFHPLTQRRSAAPQVRTQSGLQRDVPRATPVHSAVTPDATARPLAMRSVHIPDGSPRSPGQQSGIHFGSAGVGPIQRKPVAQAQQVVVSPTLSTPTAAGEQEALSRTRQRDGTVHRRTQGIALAPRTTTANRPGVIQPMSLRANPTVTALRVGSTGAARPTKQLASPAVQPVVYPSRTAAVPAPRLLHQDQLSAVRTAAVPGSTAPILGTATRVAGESTTRLLSSRNDLPVQRAPRVSQSRPLDSQHPNARGTATERLVAGIASHSVATGTTPGTHVPLVALPSAPVPSVRMRAQPPETPREPAGRRKPLVQRALRLVQSRASEWQRHDERTIATHRPASGLSSQPAQAATTSGTHAPSSSVPAMTGPSTGLPAIARPSTPVVARVVESGGERVPATTRSPRRLVHRAVVGRAQTSQPNEPPRERVGRAIATRQPVIRRAATLPPVVNRLPSREHALNRVHSHGHPLNRVTMLRQPEQASGSRMAGTAAPLPGSATSAPVQATQTDTSASRPTIAGATRLHVGVAVANSVLARSWLGRAGRTEASIRGIVSGSLDTQPMLIARMGGSYTGREGRVSHRAPIAPVASESVVAPDSAIRRAADSTAKRHATSSAPSVSPDSGSTPFAPAEDILPLARLRPRNEQPATEPTQNGHGLHGLPNGYPAGIATAVANPVMGFTSRMGVQRMEMNGAAEPTGQTTPALMNGSNGATRPTVAPRMDELELERMADEVYRVIERRLMRERERLGM